ncbi:MAG: SMC-Scp complex subunit ScpB [Defluviitaleaceae bacterium]|nr:SMC-Scp complex subunit ScpB [Defluviitaleaceae bacterium]
MVERFTEKEKMLEAMLFASPESVPLAKLAEALGAEIPATRELLAHMHEVYVREQSGIQLAEADGHFRLCSNPMYYPCVQRLLQLRPRRPLSQALLETLAVIAFKQPVTKGVIEEIRGVSSDHSVNRLVEYGLVEERGRLEAPGRPVLFGTSEDFLMFYGLKSVEELLDNASGISDASVE